MIGKSILASLFVFLLCLAGAGAAPLPQQLKVAVSVDSYPYMFTDDNGEIAGLVIDYWREVGRQQNIGIEFVAANWPDTMMLLQSGQVDLHGAVGRTPARAATFLLTDLNIDAFSNVYVMQDLNGANAIKDLQPFMIGVVENTGHLAVLKQHLPQGNFKYFPNVTAMYQAALDGQIAAFAGLDRLPEQFNGHTELRRLFPMHRRIALSRMELAFAVMPQNKVLAEQLSQATAQLSRSYLDELERKWLGVPADKDTLILGVSVNNQPYMHVSPQGDAQGLFVELWQHWAEQTGTKVVFVPDTSSNNLQNLKKGRIDVVIGFPDNSNLPQGIGPAYQLYGFKSHYFTLNQRKLAPLTSASESKVGVFGNAPYQAELRRRYPHAEFIPYRQLEDMVQATLNGELSGFFGASAIIPLRLQQLNQNDVFVAQPDSMVFAPIYSLIRDDNTELAEEIRQGFSNFTLDWLIELEKKWVVQPDLWYFPQFRQQIPLTETELSWLNSHPDLRVGMLDNWPPMEFVDDAGNPAGVTVDMFNLLSERLKVDFNIQIYSNFNDMLEALERKEIDVIANVSEQEERRRYARFTDEFWSTQWAVIGPHDAGVVISTSELNGMKVAIYKDYKLARHLNDIYPQINVVPVNSLRDGLELLQQGKVDYALDSVEAASEMVRQAGYLYLRVQILEDLPTYPSLIAVREDYAPLVVMLNKGLRSIGKEERQQLYQNWFSFQVTQGINQAQFRQTMWQIGGVAALLLTFVVIWNLSLRREVSLRRQAEQKMRFMATHDDLTQIPNRSLIKERIEQALLQHARHNEILALLFIDLDGFKEVNDQFGHEVGDELLQKLAAILGTAIRKSDTVARFGGDEFAILLTGLLSRDDAAIVAEKILHQLSEPVTLSVGEVQVGASIGIAVYPDDGTDCARLLRVADSLMYRVKQQGKNQYCFSRAVNS
ncbi:transporter substrate-binding domain-containing protein [Rheinheimera aquimaris]|uniref:transporter substrate-binding domain-containing protein n=1 Tax=Rheinheimera aquimaris TaxID=412437 RepID=UPI003A9818AA